jgi:hypothetical protein
MYTLLIPLQIHNKTYLIALQLSDSLILLFNVAHADTVRVLLVAMK